MKTALQYSIGGGVAIYVKSDYSYFMRNGLKIDSVENLCIETDDKIMRVIYKPPILPNSESLDKLEVILHSIFFLFKKKCIIMGDFNINTL